MKFGFDWPSGFRRRLIIMVMYMHIVPGQGHSDNLLGSKSFHKHKSFVNLIICCKIYPLNDFVTVFPIYTHRRPN